MMSILGYFNISDVLLYIIIMIIFVIVVDLLIKVRFTSKFDNVKCVPYLPIIGSVAFVFIFGIIGGLTKVTKQIKDSFLIWVFYKPVYCVTQPKEVQFILLNQKLLQKGSFYKYVDMMDNTLLVTDVNSWRNHRKMLNKCFNNKQLNSYSPVFCEFAELLGNDVSEEVTIKEFNEMAERRSISTFFGSVANFGPIGSHSKGFEDYVKFDLSSAMKSLTTTMMSRYLNPLYHSDFIFFNSKEGKNFLKMNELIEGAVTDIIQKKKELQKEQNNEDDGNHYFLDTIIQGYDSLDNIKNEVKFFGGASALTNSPAVSACLLMLGLHQDKQEKLYKEIVEVMGKEDKLESYHLPHLVYTDMVINETLRLFSPVPFIMRRSVNDIHTGLRIIPKDTDILIPIQNLHRDETYWENPLEFKPERFLPEEVEKRPPGCYLPFSIGPRNCIGMKYSELVLKFYVISLVRRFRISSDIKKTEDVKLSDAMFLELPDDLKLKFSRRSPT